MLAKVGDRVLDLDEIESVISLGTSMITNPNIRIMMKSGRSHDIGITMEIFCNIVDRYYSDINDSKLDNIDYGLPDDEDDEFIDNGYRYLDTMKMNEIIDKMIGDESAEKVNEESEKEKENDLMLYE